MNMNIEPLFDDILRSHFACPVKQDTQTDGQLASLSRVEIEEIFHDASAPLDALKGAMDSMHAICRNRK